VLDPELKVLERLQRGGSSLLTSRATVRRLIPNLRAISRWDSPSALNARTKRGGLVCMLDRRLTDSLRSRRVTVRCQCCGARDECSRLRAGDRANGLGWRQEFRMMEWWTFVTTMAIDADEDEQDRPLFPVITEVIGSAGGEPCSDLESGRFKSRFGGLHKRGIIYDSGLSLRYLDASFAAVRAGDVRNDLVDERL
jgi:hypothetical protein